MRNSRHVTVRVAFVAQSRWLPSRKREPNNQSHCSFQY